MRIILASSSPRRKNLLEEAKINFEVIPSNFNEDSIKNIENDPGKLVEVLSKGKGEEVYFRIANEENNFVIISSDTMVYCNNKLLGKPKDEDEAFKMIKMLQGNVHTVYTGMYIIIKKKDSEEKILTHSIANVYFKRLTDDEILEYIKNENTLDKAGAYAIQGLAKEFVERIDGNRSTVIGLDIEKLKKIFEEYKVI